MNQLEQLKRGATQHPNLQGLNLSEMATVELLTAAAYLAGQQAERIKNNLCKHGVQGNCLACYNEHNLINSKE